MAATRFKLRGIYISDRSWNELAEIARKRRVRRGECSVGVGGEHISVSEIIRQLIDHYISLPKHER